MTFSKKIAMIRSNAGLSQDEMAGKFGVSRQTISKWESGLSYPEIEKIIKISETFQVSIDYLLKDSYKSDEKEANLEKAALQFLGASQDMEKLSEQIIEIMRDGVIDDIEQVLLEESVIKIEQAIENLIRVKEAILSNR